MILTPERIAPAIRCPLANVASNWPILKQDVDALGMGSDACYIGLLATIAVETGRTFLPIHEFGTKDYFIKHYDGRSDLGNTHPGDGYRYAGRGFIQITGELNYESYGRLLGIDMIDDPSDPNDDKDPDKALLPDVAAAIAAAYFHNRKVYVACNNHDWLKVRKLVNGGTNGLNDFMLYVNNLSALEG